MASPKYLGKLVGYKFRASRDPLMSELGNKFADIHSRPGVGRETLCFLV